MKNLIEKFKGLPVPAQAIIGVIMLYIVWRIYTHLKVTAQVEKREKESKTEIEVLEEVKGVSASYSGSQYKSMADKLQVAMEGSGTDEVAVMQVYEKMQNDVDVIKLKSAFGNRISSSSWFGSPTGLNDWISSDLSESDIKSINDLLASKGIKKRVG